MNQFCYRLITAFPGNKISAAQDLFGQIYNDRDPNIKHDGGPFRKKSGGAKWRVICTPVTQEMLDTFKAQTAGAKKLSYIVLKAAEDVMVDNSENLTDKNQKIDKILDFFGLEIDG